MTIFIIPAAVIAALLLFRWARTVALLAFGALVVWGYICFAHAQQSSPMVQCRTGSISEVVPDYACTALTRGYGELRFSVADSEAAKRGMMRCADTIGRYVHKGPEQFIEVCTRMWQAEMYYRAQTQYH